MARSEARLSVDIWNDPDFRALSWSAQWCYMFLLSQQDLAHTGVLGLRVRRWAKSAEGMSIATLKAALTDLEAARFVVIDYDAEELLVRSFIRRDKVYRQPQVFRAAADALVLVTSPLLRFALAVELERVSREDMVDGSRAILADMRAALPDPTEHPAQQPPDQPDDEGEDEPAPGTPGVRGVVTVVTTGVPRTPFLEAPVPEPLALASLALGQNRASRSLADCAFDAFWAVYPRKEAKRAARKAWDHAIKRADPGDIRAGAERYRDQPGRESRFTAHAATWLNADRWADETGPARASPNGIVLGPRTTEHLARTQRMAALDAQRQPPPAIGGSS